MRIALVVACLLLLPAAAQAQSESFVVKINADTIAIETFTLTAGQLEGEFAMRGAPLRWKYSGDIVAGRIPIFRTAVYSAGDTAAAQTAATRFQGDSVIVEINSRGVSTTQRLKTSSAALPLINLAFSFIELATRNLHTDSAQVDFFLISGGQTVTGTLRRIRPDSVVLFMGGLDLVLKVDNAGRILRGRVPAQNVTIERVTATSARIAEFKPDYSAPAGASYSAQDVVIRSPQGHRLAGTLTLPKRRTGRVPVVVTISGSGLQDRDESIVGVPGYKPFRQIAEALAERGVGMLRYDDRGFGASTGNAAVATTADFARDVRAVLAWLRTRRDVDTTRLFLLGHSEGAIVAPVVAATDQRLRGLVLLAGTARTGRKVLEQQNRYVIGLRTELSAAQRDSLLRVSSASLDSAARKQPWLAHFLAYDPLTAARRVRTPVLILHGATDRQVSADQAGELAAAFRAGRNPDVTVHVIPEVNHLFLRDLNGNPATYGRLPDKRVVKGVIDLIDDWILKHVK